METKHFGFQKVQDGAMVFGKDLNKVLDSIDEKLDTYLGSMTEAGAIKGADLTLLPQNIAPPLPGAWTPYALDDEAELIFASPVKAKKARLMVTGIVGAPLVGAVQVALALASAPTVPISTIGEFGPAGTSVDTVLTCADVLIPANEEVTLVLRDKVSAGPFVALSAADIQISLEVQKVMT